MQQVRLALLVSFAWLLVAGTAGAEVRRVPADYATIMGAGELS